MLYKYHNRTLSLRRQHALVISALLAILAFDSALADQNTDSGMYVSASIGLNRIQSGLPEESSTLLKAAIGWQFTPNLGLELGYNDFGDFPGRTPAFSEFSPAGASVTAIGQLPLSPLVALFAKVGQFWWSAESDYFFFGRSTGVNQTGTLHFDESDWLLGFGGSYELTRRLELELEYNYYEFSTDGRMQFSGDTGDVVLSLKWEM